MFKNVIKFENELKYMNIKNIEYDQLFEIGKNCELNPINTVNVFLKYYSINEIDKDQDTLLHYACRHFFSNLVQYLIVHHININAKDKYGNAPLYYAVSMDSDTQIVELLLKTESIDVNNINRDQKSVLQLTIENKNVLVIKLLIKHCHSKIIKIQDNLFHETICSQQIEIIQLILPYVDNINSVNELGKSALHLACEFRNEEIIMLLLQSNIDVNLTCEEDFTALHLALSLKLDTNIIMSLLSYGANCNLSSTNNTTLQYAVEYENTDIIRRILNKLDENRINDINWKGKSALHTAIKTKKKSIVNLLLQNNINVNLATNRRKLTAIHIAFYRKVNEEIIFLLLTNGVNCNLFSDYNTILNYAIEYGNTAIIEFCLKKVYENNINDVNSQGESALHTAIKMKNEAIVDLLLEHNIDINLANGENFTALHLALDLKLSEKIIKSLLNRGANCNLNSVYDTTLNYAIKYDNTSIIKSILSQLDKTNINGVNWDGDSALHTAAIMQNEYIILYLLRNKIDVNLRNRYENFTALHIALSVKLSKKIILALFLYGANCNLSSNYNTTLNYAIEYGDTYIIKLCLTKLDKKNINDVSVKRESALHTAINMNNEIIINLLLANNIDVKLTNSENKTALQLALDRKLNEEIILSLLSYGADYNIFSGHDTTLNYAIRYNNATIIKSILDMRGRNIISINDVNDKGESALHTAIYMKNEAIINLLLQNNIDVNLTTKYEKFTAIRLAFSNALNERVIYALLKHGANCTLYFNDDTILNHAIKYGNIDIIKLVLCKLDKNNINDMNWDGNSALHTAIKLKNEAIINLLLENDIDVNLVNEKRLTPLHLALYFKLSEQIIRALLKHGADCNLNSVYDTTLNYSIKYDNIDIFTLILSQVNKSNINDVNSKRESALHTAIKMQNEAAIKLLLQNNIDVNLANSEKSTALHLALALKLNEQIIVALFEYGANCELYSTANTTLNYAIQYDNINIIKLTLSKLANNNINDVNWDGESALHTAIMMENEVVVNLLLQRNIDVNLANGGNFTALHLAFHYNMSEEIIRALLDHGADCNYPSKYEPTLHFAIRYDNINLIKLILSKLDKSSIKGLNLNYESALHIAACVGNISVINLLLVHDIDLNIISSLRHQTALQEACIRYYTCPIGIYTPDSFTDIVELISWYHSGNVRNLDNILEALYKFLNISNTKDDVYFNILHLLLFEGGDILVDARIKKFLYYMSIDELKLIFLPLVKQQQLITMYNDFFFENSIIQFKCKNDDILKFFCEITKMRSYEITVTHKTTYFQLLCMNKYEIASLLRGEEFRNELKNYDKIEKEFPEYFQLILRKCRIGKNVNIEYHVFTKCLIKSLPTKRTAAELADSIQCILAKLSKFDVSNFIEACRAVRTYN